MPQVLDLSCSYSVLYFNIILVVWILSDSCQLRTKTCFLGARANDVATTEKEEQEETEVAEGYTISQFCDKIIDIFMNEKPKTKEWRKFLVFREEWKKYRESFYSHCQRRADGESDPIMKEKLISLRRKVKRVCTCPLCFPLHLFLKLSCYDLCSSIPYLVALVFVRKSLKTKFRGEFRL